MVDQQLDYYQTRISVKAILSGGFEFKPFVAYKIRADIFEDYYHILFYDVSISSSDKLRIFRWTKL